MSGSVHNTLSGLQVTIITEAHHGSPAGGDDASSTRAIHGGRAVHAARPVGGHRELVILVLLVRVQNDRGSLRSKSVFVGIGGDTSHTLDFEIEGTQLVAGVADQSDHKTAQTGIDVDWNVVLYTQSSDGFDVVDGSIGEVGSRANKLKEAKSFIKICFPKNVPLKYSPG